MIASITLRETFLTSEQLKVYTELTGEKADDAEVYENTETGTYAVKQSWHSEETYADPKWRRAEDIHHVNTYGPKITVDIDEFTRALPTVKFEVEKVYRDNSSDVLSAMDRITQKYISALKAFEEKVEYNNSCEVHVANLGLLNINDLMLKEDCCTDELQAMLNDGWRIITVCPQPNQRRPDYVLGRYNPKQFSEDSYATAKR